MSKFDPFASGGPFGNIKKDSVYLKSEFHIFMCGYMEKEERKSMAAIIPGLDKDGKEPPFESWVAACEHFIGVVASKSEAGFEKALELLAVGAMRCRRHITGLGPNHNPLPTPEG
jgi:hypothetical protein